MYWIVPDQAVLIFIFINKTVGRVCNFNRKHMKMEHLWAHEKAFWLYCAFFLSLNIKWFGSIWLGNRKDQMSSRDQISILEIRLDRLRQCLLKWLEEPLWNETWHLFSTVCQEYLVANLKLTKSVCVYEKKRKRVSSSGRLIWGVTKKRCCRLLSVQSVTEQAIHWLDPLCNPDLSSCQLMSSASTLYLHLKWLLWDCPVPHADWRVLSFDSQVNTDLQATLVSL